LQDDGDLDQAGPDDQEFSDAVKKDGNLGAPPFV
jgi:hypothetical protein